MIRDTFQAAVRQVELARRAIFASFQNVPHVPFVKRVLSTARFQRLPAAGKRADILLGLARQCEGDFHQIGSTTGFRLEGHYAGHYDPSGIPC